VSACGPWAANVADNAWECKVHGGSRAGSRIDLENDRCDKAPVNANIAAKMQQKLHRRGEEFRLSRADLRDLVFRIEQLDLERLAVQSKERLLTCVFCGHAYEPGTPASNHESLRAHVAECQKHPAAAFRARAEEAEARVEAIKGLRPDADALEDSGRAVYVFDRAQFDSACGGPYEINV
jgi:hypothetical protein